MVAQALIERGLLESLSLGIMNVVTGVGGFVEAQPYLTIVVIVVVGLWLVRRR